MTGSGADFSPTGSGDVENDFLYEYDALGRLAKVTAVERNNVTLTTAEETTYGYDLQGNLARQGNPNGTIAAYSYDDLNRLDVLTHYLPDATPADLSDNDKLAEFDYTVRADGRRTSALETFWFDSDSNGIAEAHQNNVSWTYDDAGRVTDEVFDHYDDLLDQTQHFTFDLNGNRLARTVDTGNDGTIDQAFAYDYDANDRLLEERLDQGNNSTVDQTTTFGYDQTQQTSKTVQDASFVTRYAQTFAYNLQGRMAQVDTDTFDGSGALTQHEAVAYEYGPDGIRITALHEVDSDADGTFDTRELTEYLIDTSNHTGYQQVLQETVKDADTGTVIKKVVYTIGLDQISQTTFTPGGLAEGETLVFHADGHGSTRVLTDIAAAIAAIAGTLQIFNYDAYGNAIGFDQSAAATTHLYSGEQFDSRIQQQYLRARYFDASTGRFNRLDPFFGSLTEPQSFHKYLYTHADPVNGADPTGKFLIGLGIAVGIGILLGGIFGGISACWNGCTSGEFWNGVGTGALLGGLGGLIGFLTFAGFAAVAGMFMGSLATFWIATLLSGFTTGFILSAGTAWWQGKSNEEIISEGLVGGLTGAVFAGIGGLVFRAAAPVWLRYRGRPQGIPQDQWDDFARTVRDAAGQHGDDIVVQGSRAQGIARRTSDVDVGIRVDGDEFDDLIQNAFGNPNPGSAKERTMLHAINTGKIQAGEAGYRGLRRSLQEMLGMKVDISIILRGGPFDTGPVVPLP